MMKGYIQAVLFTGLAMALSKAGPIVTSQTSSIVTNTISNMQTGSPSVKSEAQTVANLATQMEAVQNDSIVTDTDEFKLVSDTCIDMAKRSDETMPRNQQSNNSSLKKRNNGSKVCSQNTSDEDSATESGKTVSNRTIAVTLLLGVVSLAGILGNCALIIALKMFVAKKPLYLLILNLSVIDLITCAYCLPLLIYTNYTEGEGIPSLMCQVSGLIHGVLFTAMLFTHSVVAFYCFMALQSHSNFHMWIMKLRVVSILIILTWVIGFAIVCIMPLLGIVSSGYQTTLRHCVAMVTAVSPQMEHLYRSLVLLVATGSNTLACLGLYVALFKTSKVENPTNVSQQCEPSAPGSLELSVTSTEVNSGPVSNAVLAIQMRTLSTCKVMVLVFILVCISWIPFSLSQYLLMMFPNIPLLLDATRIASYLPFIASAVNPFIYGKRIPGIRNGLRLIVSSRRSSDIYMG